MTLWGAVAGFAVAAGLLTIVPGLDTALVVRAAVSAGRRAAFATALGITTGALVWGAAAAAGVSAVLTASHALYVALRVAGAAYLVWLGVRLLASACRGDVVDLAAGAAVPPGPWVSWRRGLLTNLLNPKVGAFYVAVLPQFLPTGAPHVAVGLLLALVHDVEGMVWFTALILGAGTLRRWLASRRTQRTVDAVTGTALLGVGLRLAWPD